MADNHWSLNKTTPSNQAKPITSPHGKNRLEAFSDGVLAILIIILVLELRVPHGPDWATLQPLLPLP